MHPLYVKADAMTYQVIGSAMEVHREKGPGLPESIYERCLMHELSLRKIATVNQKLISIRYKDLIFEEALRLDVMVDDCLLVEAKSVEHVVPIHKAQLLSYMKLLSIPVGLLINFHEVVLKNGIVRLILPGANLP